MSIDAQDQRATSVSVDFKPLCYLEHLCSLCLHGTWPVVWEQYDKTVYLL